jgi:peptidoglycan hydrolase CwlO-like protein
MRPKSAKQPGAQGLVTLHAKAGNSNFKASNAFAQRFGYAYGNVEVQSRDRLPNEEQILRELLHFKQDANNFKLENIQLKTRIQQYEKEIEKKNKLIKSIMEQMESTQEGMFVRRQFDGETSAVLNLKKQVKELREDIKAKDEIGRAHV